MLMRIEPIVPLNTARGVLAGFVVLTVAACGGSGGGGAASGPSADEIQAAMASRMGASMAAGVSDVNCVEADETHFRCAYQLENEAGEQSEYRTCFAQEADGWTIAVNSACPR